MKKLVFFIIFIPIYSFSQNLVPNPSFEEYVMCPLGIGTFDGFCATWQKYRSSPDYFNVCCTDTSAYGAWIPLNSAGFQYPINGEAYAGIVTITPSSSNYRECIGAELITPLVISQTYSVRFKISRAESYSDISTNKIGIKFTNQPYNVSSPIPIDNTAHVFIDSIITDSINWFEFQAEYTADDTYSYIVIGNFFDNSNTNVFPNDSSGTAYYYIDDICVSRDPNRCDFTTSAKLIEMKENQLNVYPNPVNGIINIKAKGICKVEMFDSQGKIVYSNNDESDECTIETEKYLKGLYFIKVVSNSGTEISKIVIE